MADNVTLQSSTLASAPSGLAVAAIEATFSGDTVKAGLSGLVSSAGAEGSRTLTLINPATSDKQPALGVAGTPSADVLSIQGRSGMTAIDVNITGDTVGATSDTEDGNIAGGQTTVALTAGLTYQWNGSNWERVTRPGLNAQVSVTRPSDTTAYGAGDVVGVTGGGTATMTFALGAISAACIMITSVRLQRNATAVISGEVAYRLHLFNVTQPGAQIDNAVFDVASGDQASYLGYVDIAAPVDLGSTLVSENNAINKQVKLAGTSLFGVLQTVGGYTPVSAAVHVVTVNAVQL